MTGGSRDVPASEMLDSEAIDVHSFFHSVAIANLSDIDPIFSGQQIGILIQIWI